LIQLRGDGLSLSPVLSQPFSLKLIAWLPQPFPLIQGLFELLIGSVFGWIDLYDLSLSYYIPVFLSLLIFEFIKPAVLLHAVEDAVINPLVIDGHISITSGMEIFISPICGIIPTALYLMIGLWLRGRRILNN